MQALASRPADSQDSGRDQALLSLARRTLAYVAVSCMASVAVRIPNRRSGPVHTVVRSSLWEGGPTCTASDTWAS